MTSAYLLSWISRFSRKPWLSWLVVTVPWITSWTSGPCITIFTVSAISTFSSWVAIRSRWTRWSLRPIITLYNSATKISFVIFATGWLPHIHLALYPPCSHDSSIYRTKESSYTDGPTWKFKVKICTQISN